MNLTIEQVIYNFSLSDDELQLRIKLLGSGFSEKSLDKKETLDFYTRFLEAPYTINYDLAILPKQAALCHKKVIEQIRVMKLFKELIVEKIFWSGKEVSQAKIVNSWGQFIAIDIKDHWIS